MRLAENLISLTSLRRWLLTFAVLLSPHVHALGLGEIRVDSNLGQPLRASIPLAEAGGVDLIDLKARMAGAEEYRKSGLQFPEGVKFRLRVTQEGGHAPQIEISSSRSLNEPFLELLVELSSPAGKLSKSYTVLLDPAPDLIEMPRAEVAPEATAIAAPERPQASVSAVAPPVGMPHKSVVKSPRAPAVRVVSPRKQKTSRTAGALSAELGQHTQGDIKTKVTQFGKLSLTLSTSLTISKNAPGLPLSAPENADAVQEELIAREKTLSELNAQIAEMKEVIKALQGRLGIQPVSGVALDDEWAAAASAAGASEAASSIVVSAAVPVVSAVPAAAAVSLTERKWLKPLIGGGLILVALGVAVFWYHRRQGDYQWYEGPFDELPENESVTETIDPPTSSTVPQEKPPASAKPVDVGSISSKLIVKQELLGETSMKVPAYQKQKLESNVPPEYDMLEEADVYLRFGHDKLAEEVLLEAIGINPNNPHAYLTLLGIYASRNDASIFFTWAQKVKVLGDAKAWLEVCEMGHKLEPDNPFYH